MGDKILKVNDISMETATHEDAVMCLVSQEGDIELHVRHEAPPPGLQEVIITKGGNKLGVSIKGGGPESVGNPFDVSDEGIFVSKVSSTTTVNCMYMLTVTGKNYRHVLNDVCVLYS